MSLSLTFRRQARREFDEAANWYEQRRAGLGARFVAAVERVLDQAAVNPGRYAEVLEGVREGLVQEFPYCVYFRKEGEQIVVFAVFHVSRDPAIWQSRA
jgi:plasmid stabilization system protein ParE